MWEMRSHTLAPLTKITSSKVEFECTKIKQGSFDEIKQIVIRDTLLAYMYFNKAFKIHTYASYFQLGAVIIQKVKSIALYGRKLAYSQKRYTVTEK